MVPCHGEAVPSSFGKRASLPGFYLTAHVSPRGENPYLPPRHAAMAAAMTSFTGTPRSLARAAQSSYSG